MSSYIRRVIINNNNLKRNKMKNLNDFKSFVKANIKNDYTIVDFLEVDNSKKIERMGLIIVEKDEQEETFTTLGYYSNAREIGELSARKVLNYNAEGYDVESEKNIDGIYVIDVKNVDYIEYRNLIDNNWGEEMVRASKGNEIEL